MAICGSSALEQASQLWVTDSQIGQPLQTPPPPNSSRICKYTVITGTLKIARLRFKFKIIGNKLGRRWATILL